LNGVFSHKLPCSVPKMGRYALMVMGYTRWVHKGLTYGGASHTRLTNKQHQLLDNQSINVNLPNVLFAVGNPWASDINEMT